MDDYAQLVDAANEQLTRRAVMWLCVYCGHEVPEEHAACCGEVGHTEAVSMGGDDEAF